MIMILKEINNLVVPTNNLLVTAKLILPPTMVPTKSRWTNYKSFIFVVSLTK